MLTFPNRFFLMKYDIRGHERSQKLYLKVLLLKLPNCYCWPSISQTDISSMAFLFSSQTDIGGQHSSSALQLVLVV